MESNGKGLKRHGPHREWPNRRDGLSSQKHESKTSFRGCKEFFDRSLNCGWQEELIKMVTFGVPFLIPWLWDVV